jgi:hypothetical protein
MTLDELYTRPAAPQSDSVVSSNPPSYCTVITGRLPLPPRTHRDGRRFGGGRLYVEFYPRGNILVAMYEFGSLAPRCAIDGRGLYRILAVDSF